MIKPQKKKDSLTHSFETVSLLITTTTTEHEGSAQLRIEWRRRRYALWFEPEEVVSACGAHMYERESPEVSEEIFLALVACPALKSIIDQTLAKSPAIRRTVRTVTHLR